MISWCKLKPVQCNDIKNSPRIINKIYSSKKYMLYHWHMSPYITALDGSRWEAELTIVYLVEHSPCYRWIFFFWCNITDAKVYFWSFPLCPHSCFLKREIPYYKKKNYFQVCAWRNSNLLLFQSRLHKK